jgi:hypothetical protein
MRAHYLQDIPFEGLGSTAPWLGVAEYEVINNESFNSAKYHDLKMIDLLVIMGRKMK